MPTGVHGATDPKKGAEMTVSSSGNEDPTVKSVLYGVEDTPPLPMLLLFAFQQIVMVISPCMSMAFVMSDLLCAGHQPEVTAKLLSTSVFMSGIATIMQSAFGIRLGIVQGASFAFIGPVLAMMAIEERKCSGNTTEGESQDKWIDNLREVQGSLMLASVTQVLLGATGAIGVLMRFIGPLTIAPTIALVGIAFFKVAADLGEVHWGICFMTFALVLLFALFLEKVNVPLPFWSKDQGCHMKRLPVFQLYSIIMSIILSWIFCHIMTVTEVFPNEANITGYYARTDVKLSVLDNSPWFYWPYPFQYGYPKISAAGFVGMLAATIASIIESIGDYYATARVSMVAAPPVHAVNRGVMMEGLASIVAGMVGLPHGTTSYSCCVGAIGITKVASRNTAVAAGVIMVICGVFGKFGAFLSMLPEPVAGGSLIVLMGLGGATGLSVLKFVNLDSMRNLTILGVALLLGLMIPDYINNPDHAHVINTGNREFDHTLKVLFGTAMFVGGIVGFVLDNAVPGTLEERGIKAMQEASIKLSDKDNTGTGQKLHIYDYPFVTDCLRKTACCSYVPVSPTFKNTLCVNMGTCCQLVQSKNEDEESANITLVN